MARRLLIHGELHLTLEDVAQCFELEISWVQEVYDLGVLGTGQRVGDSVAIAARQLDRIAEVRRLHLQTGLDLVGIALLLGPR